MQRKVWLILTMTMLSIDSGLSGQKTPQSPIIHVDKRTVIAFYSPMSKTDKADTDANEALSDFQFNAGQMKLSLSKAGIDFREIYVRSFRLHLDRGLVVFHPKTGVGYYLIAPGKKPHVEYGVMTDADLMVVARHYFGLPAADE